jgi:uncharacterized protein with PQ loop repeat
MLGEVLSWVMSTLSNIVWLFVFIPQILENKRNKSSVAISFYLILLWYIGDTLSSISVVYKNAKPMLLYVGIYHIIFDLIFITQVIYYRLPTIQTYPHLLNENTYQYDLIFYIKDVIKMEEVSMFFGYNLFLLIILPVLQHIPHQIIGNILAWLSTIIFLVSRLPQILLNHKRRSVSGLSFITFINISIANQLFLISVLINLLDFTTSSLKSKFIFENLPWIVGSSGTIFFDTIIFVQFLKYKM